MWLDLLVVVLVLLLGWLGARGGPLQAGLRLAAIPLAYGAAFGAAAFFGAGLASRFALPELAGQVLAGSGAFLVSYGVLSAMAGVAGRRAREDGVSPLAQLLGGGLGALRAAVLLIPILWVANLAEGARQSGVGEGLPDLSSSQLREAPSGLLEAGAGVTLGDGAEGRMAKRWIAHPGASLNAMNELMEDPNLRIIQTDQGFWRDLEEGRVTNAMARPTWRQLASDPSFRERLGSLGFVSQEAVTDEPRFRAELTQTLADVGERLGRVRSDPQLGELLEDPEVQRQLQEGDTLALLADPRFQQLVARVTEGAQ
jgi:hypothetical protein